MSNVSHEWCDYIVKNALEKYVVLLYVDQSWETNLINTTELSNTIIHAIINSIVFGHAYVPWYYGAADAYVIQENNDPRIDDLYIIERARMARELLDQRDATVSQSSVEK